MYEARNSFWQASQKKAEIYSSTVPSKGPNIVRKLNTDLWCTPKKKNQTEVVPRVSDVTFTCPLEDHKWAVQNYFTWLDTSVLSTKAQRTFLRKQLHFNFNTGNLQRRVRVFTVYQSKYSLIIFSHLNLFITGGCPCSLKNPIEPSFSSLLPNRVTHWPIRTTMPLR